MNGLKYCIIDMKSYIFLSKLLIFPKNKKLNKKKLELNQLIEQNGFKI